MKKLMRLIKEEIVPLSRRQNIVLMTMIACVFQFVLFYAPALADQAVKEAKAQEISEEMMISGGFMTKELFMDPEAAKLSPNNNIVVEMAYPAKPISSQEIIIKNDDLLDKTSSSSMSVITGPENKPVEKYKVTKTSTHTMTAYNSEVGQTDDTPCITANGFNVCKHGVEDTVAANFLPMGTKIRIPDLFGDRVFTVRDRMNKKHPNRVDIWMLKRADAIQFGVRTAKIEILQEI